VSIKLEMPSGELRRTRLSSISIAALRDACIDARDQSDPAAATALVLEWSDDEGDTCRLTTDVDFEEALWF
jgi:hypothetical protein